MKVAFGVVGVAVLLMGGWIAPATAQQAAPAEAPAVAQTPDEEADRAAIRGLFARAEVQRAARIGGIDLDGAEARLSTLQGEPLQRAATQARALDSRLGAADVITVRTTTLIVILLLVIIIILLA